MSLPQPVLSYDDIVVVQSASRQYAHLIWNTWSQDPIKAAVLRATFSCQNRLYYYDFLGVLSVALGQNIVCFPHSVFIGSGGSAFLKCFQEYSRIVGLLIMLNGYPGLWRSPVINVQEETSSIVLTAVIA